MFQVSAPHTFTIQSGRFPTFVLLESTIRHVLTYFLKSLEYRELCKLHVG